MRHLSVGLNSIYLDLYRLMMMIHRHRDGSDRRFALPDDMADRRHEGHHRHNRGHHSGGRRGGRFFDYGDLRLVALAMIAEQPRHGYEIIKGIEERMAGSYSPSPGVIYPTLSWLEDMGYTVPETENGARKRYHITAEGEAFLAANSAGIDALFSRIDAAGTDRPKGVPAPVVRAMENLKLALRLRLRSSPVDQSAAETIAAALDAAAQTVERS